MYIVIKMQNPLVTWCSPGDWNYLGSWWYAYAADSEFRHLRLLGLEISWAK